MEIIKYPDGSSYVTVNNMINTEGDNGEYIFKINSYEDLWHLNQFVDAYNSENYMIPTIIIPNLIDAQADKRFNKNESSGLKLVCQFLNNMKANFKIFHPHNPEVVEALMDNVEIIDNSEFIAEVINILVNPEGVAYNRLNTPDDLYDNLILMSSDAGGFKPLMKLCDKIGWKGETVSASKSREWTGTESKLIQTVPLFDLDKDILIIDDISVKGGTFKGLSKIIKSVGHRGKLYLAVSHMTVENLGEDPITNYFDKVFTTNSKFDSYECSQEDPQFKRRIQPNENLEIIKLF